jgi:hypothetical protein
MMRWVCACRWCQVLVLMACFFPPSLTAQERRTEQRKQSFDSDPKWDAQNNRVEVQPNPVAQDFGFSDTNFAKGTAAGEIGGRIQRSSEPAWYGKKLAAAKTLDDPLRCSGTFAVTQTSGMSSMYFGWFNTQTMDVRPRNFLGMMLNGEGKGCEVHLSYSTSLGQSDGFRATGTGPKGAAVRDFNLIPNDGTPYTFELVYDPKANDGNGEITFTLGGQGPFTGGPFKFKVSPAQRNAGATYDAFGIVNPQSAGNALTIHFDDVTNDGQLESFDSDPGWLGRGNRAKFDDYGLEGAHRFGFSDTAHAGGRRGELGGLIYSSPSVPGYYGDDIGRLTLDDRLVASGKVALERYGSDGGLYIGWFDSQKRGWPPANVLGVLIDGPTSTGPAFRGCAASSDPKLAHVQRETAPLIPPDGASHTWKIEYEPTAVGGRGRVTVWLDNSQDAFTLPDGVRKKGASFNRFGLFVHEGGGRASQVFFDDVEYTAAAAESNAWPPDLKGAKNGTVTLQSDLFLRIPDSVAAAAKDGSAVSFDVAKTPPTVDLAFHRELGPDAAGRRLWSSWGDICVASDGTAYCGIGDHGNDVGGDARCFIYRWLPDKKELVQVVDMNRIVPQKEGQPAWSKIHAKIDEAADGRILFSCTLNDGNRAKLPTHHWNDSLPGGQLYALDPKTGKTSVVTSLPPRRCTATSLLDRERNIWWCNLEAGDGNALWGFDLAKNQPVYQSPDGTIAFNRAFALARDGSIYFNGDGSLGKYDAKSAKLESTKASLGESPGMRSATLESSRAVIYGTTHQTNQLFAISAATGELTLLGSTWLEGEYTTVTVLSPDERFLYYLPGAHGRAWQSGTPVIQYDIATGRRKVLAFLAAALENEYGYVPGGTYGVKLSADGGTLFVNFNGHAADAIRPANMKPIGFGLTAFAAIHIPPGER